MWSRRLMWTCLAGLAMCLAGCVNETNKGGKTTITFSLWVPLAVVAGSLAATAIGAVVRKHNKRIGYVLLIGGPAALIVVAPGIFLDRVDIDRNELRVRTGFWFLPNEHRIDLREVSQIEIIAETRRTRRGARTDHKLVFDRHDGTTQTVPAGDLLKASLPTLISSVSEQGINVVDRTGG